MEHFWKGLSNDRTQISPVPPHEYGERFMNFISAVTMSAEEARRDAQERDAAHQAAAATGNQDHGRIGSWGSTSRHSRASSHMPPIPNYKPPPPPVNRSGALSPEQEVTLEKAEYQAEKTIRHGAREEDVPERTLKTASAPPSMGSITVPIAERRDGSVTGAASVLPVVEEAAEGMTSPPEAQSRNSRISTLTTESEGQPPTPAKDSGYMPSLSGGVKLAPPHPSGPPPPIPSKTGYGTNLKPESADSGYGVAEGLKTMGSVRSMSGKESVNRESLDKELPPLPGMI